MAQLLPVSTASPKDSIWQNLDQGAFRKRIDDLKAKNDCPGDPKEHTQKEWRRRSASTSGSNRTLPFDVEQRVADDLAFIAAAQKDVKAVSAICLEEGFDSHGLTVRLATNGAIPSIVIDSLRSVFDLLELCAKKRGLDHVKKSLSHESLIKWQVFHDMMPQVRFLTLW